MTPQRRRGDETRHRLLEWEETSKAAERLAGHILISEGYISIDPAHPLGGPDRLRDLQCEKHSVQYIAAAYFPRGKKHFSHIQRKFKNDVKGVDLHAVRGFAFVTNQPLSLSDRQKLIELRPDIDLQLYHLDRLAQILDSPQNYGTRLSFLDIEMTKEEQLSLFATISGEIRGLQNQVEQLTIVLNNPELAANIPAKKLAEFRSAVESLVGVPGLITFSAPMDRLHPPLNELHQYAQLLYKLTGGPNTVVNMHDVDRLRPPLGELREYAKLLYEIVGHPSFVMMAPVTQLRPPVAELRDYVKLLDEALLKARALPSVRP